MFRILEVQLAAEWFSQQHRGLVSSIEGHLCRSLRPKHARTPCILHTHANVCPSDAGEYGADLKYVAIASVVFAVPPVAVRAYKSLRQVDIALIFMSPLPT